MLISITASAELSKAATCLALDWFSSWLSIDQSSQRYAISQNYFQLLIALYLAYSYFKSRRYFNWKLLTSVFCWGTKYFNDWVFIEFLPPNDRGISHQMHFDFHKETTSCSLQTPLLSNSPVEKETFISYEQVKFENQWTEGNPQSM